ncbi:MAG TPA: asparagine synthase (glutamine-hydrolyzing) [Pyrinomonadaceae bacterium]|nr:asparagine synthase (glutamine-hydrolyzing) [Pyrinomonadaceae bacterium]
MCGICGVWGEVGREPVEAMVAAMHHRGPDDRGIYLAQGVALGMTRLSIIDLTPAGHQPMSNAEKTVWIVYNGEVYNFQSERALLEAKGYRFSSTSDTEVVLRMYEYYGDDFLQRLRGIFALAIYDARRGSGQERLLLARDHLGIKPLLFARIGGRLIFASELKAILASGLLTPEIDPVALRLLLTYGSVYQPRTILKNVEMLLPAHRLIIEHGVERIERYWSLGIDRKPDLRARSYDELVEEVVAVLEESVRLQMVSDVPLGAFLSGGVDSSLLVAMMARIAGDRIKTFSVGFESEGAEIDESDDAERTARFLGTDHSAVIVRGEDVRDRIEHIAYSLDQPSVDGVNSYFVSMAARRAVTVAISGTGGDELFAGYPWFINMVLEQADLQHSPWKALARTLLATIARQPAFDPLATVSGGQGFSRARNCAGFVARYANNYQIFGALGAARLLAPELRKQTQAGRALHYDLNAMDELPQGSVIERVTGLCLRGYTNNQLLRDIDAVSMAHSLEVRVPFLDPVVVDTALSIPDSAKLRTPSDLAAVAQGTYRETGAKRILIDAGRPFLPKDFDLQSKRGFGMPFGTWLRGPLREVFMDTFSESALKRRKLLDVSEASAIKERFLSGERSWVEPWLLMMLELWCREVLDRAPSAHRPNARQWEFTGSDRGALFSSRHS